MGFPYSPTFSSYVSANHEKFRMLANAETILFFLLKKVRAFLLPVQRISNKVKLKFSLGQTWWISIGGWKVIIYDYGMEEGIGDQGEGDQGWRGQGGRMRGGKGEDSTWRWEQDSGRV
jgi:hypothetical protein